MKKILVILNTDNRIFDNMNLNIYYINSIKIKNMTLHNLFILIKLYDVIIIGGGPQRLSNQNYPEIINLMNIVKICDFLNKLLIGICLGCQIIAKFYNFKIYELYNRHIGTKFLNIDSINYNIINQDNYLKNINIKLIKYAYSYHYDGIYISKNYKNNNIDIIAYSIDNIPYIIKHKTKSIYGFQFHPEATLKSITHRLNNDKIPYQIDVNYDILFKKIKCHFVDMFLY